MAKKDLVLAILGKKKPMEDKEEMSEKESDSCEDCAKEMLAAIAAKDATRLADALKTFWETMEYQEHEEEEEEV